MEANQESGRLLERHAVLRSTDVAEIEHMVLTIFGARRFDVAGRQPALDVAVNYWSGSAVALSFCRQDGAATALKFSEARFFRQHFAMSGNIEVQAGRRDHALMPHSSCLVPADQPLVLRAASGFDNLVLRIDRGFLAAKLAAMTGAAEPRLNPNPRLQSDPAGSARLERLVLFLVSELERENPSAPFLAEIEQALAVAFICANPQLLETALPERTPAPGHHRLRAAQDYIEAHWDQPVTLEGLAAAARTSTRSLFLAFRKAHGKTPMQYLKEVRLRHARHMLEHMPGVTVTAVAFACGFGNLGHFARDYRRAWGECPSQSRAARRFKN
jgi:AraC-like DNA-binding protein